MAIPNFYVPSDWYWIIDGNTTIVYSSKSTTYVAVADPAYAAFVSGGGKATKIASEAELEAVLAAQYPAGWTSSSSASAATAAST